MKVNRPSNKSGLVAFLLEKKDNAIALYIDIRGLGGIGPQ